jgi:predicted DCC family thiol-disulfide oxidoreductase YuxK
MARPALIFDGDCDFCRYWVERWRERTGNAIEYIPFQDPSVVERFPDIPLERFKRAVQFVDRDGESAEGAHAVFRLLASTGMRWPLWTCQHVPGFSTAAEGVYRFVAHHRPLFWRLTRMLRGRDRS